MSAQDKTDKIKLPHGWHVLESKANPGKVYYFNEFSRVSRWRRPSNLAKPHKVRARHILVKHKDVRNPKSSRLNAPVTRTREEALEKIKGHAMVVKSERRDSRRLEEKFQKIAREESDCSSFKHNGDLNEFTPKQMQKAFSNAAFALAVNEVSGIIESNSGFHIILRTK